VAVTIMSAADWAEAIDEEMRYLRVTDHRVLVRDRHVGVRQR
jgi:hypothetical protein